MKSPSKEWGWVEELSKLDALLTCKQQEFIRDLKQNLDPHSPFLDQKQEKALRWLTWIHAKYVLKEEIDW